MGGKERTKIAQRFKGEYLDSELQREAEREGDRQTRVKILKFGGYGAPGKGKKRENEYLRVCTGCTRSFFYNALRDSSQDWNSFLIAFGLQTVFL